MDNKLLKNIVETRQVLRNKLRAMKLNTENHLSMLEDTFQPITKPLNEIVNKMKQENKTT